MNTKNKHFSYVNTDTLQWGNPSLLNNSKKSRGAILRTSSSHLPFLPLTPCPLTCSQPRALPLGWDQRFSASPHPSPRVVAVHPTLLCTPVSSHPLLAPGLSAGWHPLLPPVPLTSSPLKPRAPGPKEGASARTPHPRPAPSPTPSPEGWVSEWWMDRGRHGGSGGAAGGGLLEHGFFFLLLFLLPVHHCHDNVPLLLGQVAQVGQLLHGGRHGGWASTAGPHGRGHGRGLPAPSSGSGLSPFGCTPSSAAPLPPFASQRSPPGGGRRSGSGGSSGAGETASPVSHGCLHPPSPGCCLCCGRPR